MDLKKRYFRRPFTTILWLILVVAMTAFLCVGTGLWYSSANLTGIMDELHTAIALRTDMGATSVKHEGGTRWTFEDRSLTQADLDALESMDSVKAVRFHSLTGGCSPELTAVLGLQVGRDQSSERYTACNDSYEKVMLVGRVETIWPDVEQYGFTSNYSQYYGGSPEDLTGDYQFTLIVEEIILANEDYKIESMIVDMPDVLGKEENMLHGSLGGTLDVLEGFLEEGQRYVFYMNYNPMETYYNADNLKLDGCCPSVFNMYDIVLRDGDNLYAVDNSHPAIDVNKGGYDLESSRAEGTMGQYLDVCIARLDGTFEEFLADPENALWAQTIELWNMAQHSLPVIGTENLESVYTFLSHETNMVDGRMFTQEEYDQGARVCILSQTLARKNGIQVGDTIHLSQFLCDEEHIENYSVSTDPDGKLNDPTVGRITQSVEFITEDEEFTVVGLYLSSNEWSDTSYSFTPNTIFIPKSAQPEGAFGGVDYTASRALTFDDGNVYTVEYPVAGGSYGVYMTIELKNGHMDNFLGQIQDTRLAGQFYTVDQGFEKAYQSIEAVMESAAQVMLMVAAGWLLLLALYVLLYQGSQKRNLGIMRSLGASPKAAGNYLFVSGTLLAAVGIALGTAISGGVFRVVQSRILETTLSQVETTAYSTGTGLTPDLLADMAASSQFSIPMLLALSLAQLAVIAAVLWLQSRTLAKKEPRRLLGV